MPRVGEDLRQYLRVEMLPNVWCPGCGHGNILRGFATALDRLQLDLDKLVVLGGIGCSGRTPFYMNANAMHTTHGRALAFATGLKLARPDLTLVVTMGDGDAAAIGGNHFIHACRRNLDLTAIVYNNGIYGMTGGQQAPTTPAGFRSSTTPLGNIEPPFDIVKLALAAGATYVARSTTFDFDEIPRLIAEAIAHPGFAVVEVLSQCPTYYGRMNALGDAAAMLDYERDLTYPQEPITREQLVGKLPIGVFRKEVRPEYAAEYAKLCRRAGEGAVPDDSILREVRPGKAPRPSRPVPRSRGSLPTDPFRVRLSGTGGQGVILAGVLLADAGMYDDLNVVHTQSYGPEARLGACKSDLALSRREIAFSEAGPPDVLLCLSRDAYRKYGDALAPGGLRVAEERLHGDVGAEEALLLPILRTAADAGGEIAANVVALGALVALTGVVSAESLRRAVRERVKSEFVALNEKALEAGLRLGEQAAKGATRPPAGHSSAASEVGATVPRAGPRPRE